MALGSSGRRSKLTRSHLDYVRDIREAMENESSFVEGMAYSDFVDDAKTVMAVERTITVIGEASRNVPDEVRHRFPAIPWVDMVGMRNLVTHACFRVNQETVWKTVTAVIPEILPSISLCLEKLETDEPHRG